jgi:hypothetical protein
VAGTSPTSCSEAPSREQLLEDAQVEVEAFYPEIRLESPVQGWAYLERFEAGIKTYAQLIAPTAVDDRWLGVCHFQLLDDMRALEAFYRAVARGEIAARINLAHLLRFLERGGEASSELRAVRPSDLNPYDRVFLLRVTSLDEENNGNLREALRTAEEAWKHVQGLPEFGLLAPPILAQLGILHGRIGRSQRALWFLERGLQITTGLERKKVLLRRVPVLTSLGRLHEAAAELDAISNAALPDSFAAELDMLRGEIAWAKGALEIAVGHFARCLTAAARLQVTYEEFVSRLSLVAMGLSDQDRLPGQEHLSRAQSLISDKSDRLAYRFREIGLRLRLQEYTPEHALKEYEALDGDFGAMGLLQEQGFLKLHIAALLLGIDPRRSSAVLDDLQSLCVTLQNHAFLAKEWSLLPELRRVAKRTHPEILGEQSDILEVRSLGEEGLYFAGERISIPLRRLVEVVAYFLEYKAVSLTKLLSDVFPDEKPRSAKSYFHQCRHQLKEYVPAVQIEFDREARMYRLRSQVDIVWDVAEVRAGRREGDFGLFLPSSGSDWALMLDHGLDRYRAGDRDYVLELAGAR